MRRAWLVGPLPPDDGGDGAEEDLDVLPDAVGEDVFLVEAHLLAEGDFAAAHHLPEAGDAGDDVEALAVLEGVLADFVRGWRPGADEAHVADEDIPELGELVDARAADDAADAGDAGVAPHLEDHAVGGLVPGGERGLAGLGVGAHAAELPEFEVAAVAADADLVEEDGAGAVNPDGEGDDEEKREEEDKAGGAEGDVHEALGDVGGGDGESPRLEVQAAAAVAAPVRGQLPYELVEVGVLGSVEKTFHVQADASMALAQRRRHCGVCGGGGGTSEQFLERLEALHEAGGLGGVGELGGAAQGYGGVRHVLVACGEGVALDGVGDAVERLPGGGGEGLGGLGDLLPGGGGVFVVDFGDDVGVAPELFIEVCFAAVLHGVCM